MGHMAIQMEYTKVVIHMTMARQGDQHWAKRETENCLVMGYDAENV